MPRTKQKNVFEHLRKAHAHSESRQSIQSRHFLPVGSLE